jgi:nucleoside-diphosphate-sugar epimerase
MKRGLVLINGAGGFLGRHTAEVFMEAGYRVRVTDIPSVSLEWAEGTGAEIQQADLLDFGQACDVVSGVDGVVNVVGLFDLSATYETLHAVNVKATENMCRASLEAGVKKFVHIASIGVYGLPAYTPIDEAGPKSPKNWYELTKKLGEDVVFEFQRQHGLPATSLRPGPIYGPRSRYIHNLIFATSILLARSKRGGIALDDGPFCHHVHVRDVARASVHLMRLPRTIGNAYNCCDRTPIKWNRLFEAIDECIGATPKKIHKWRPALVRVLIKYLVPLIPKGRWEQVNKNLRRAWTTLIDRYDLDPALMPRVEPDMFGYMLADHVYDTSALQETGFQWDYPDTVEGLKATYEWLVEQRWIPPRDCVAERTAA